MGCKCCKQKSEKTIKKGEKTKSKREILFEPDDFDQNKLENLRNKKLPPKPEPDYETIEKQESMPSVFRQAKSMGTRKAEHNYLIEYETVDGEEKRKRKRVEKKKEHSEYVYEYIK
ncbi:Oidioi.mRNA.OKI2018_I69.chr1.g449.t1.cds [Oikopleura dioica]|uniref:Oidioi.mRNA.OKI2018_I69.chr1.g449.t1.cds n=1 Tax=Oikopleura dioica TaxID=34765 RepID=A0ABN7SS32_OIKDI|nr:Oidioi.mRNA.OKI2018_I69.chr1.g449.t1.cds [Oikopleura dioica]